MFRDLLGLLFPNLCIGCNHALVSGEAHLCSSCLYNLPQTRYHLQKENLLAGQLRGRFSFEQAFAYLHFRKEGIAQKILYELKYKGNKELAEFIGRTYGQEIKSIGAKPDAVVAVPLHQSKLRKRGYNQSAYFANGLAEALSIPNCSSAVGKKTATTTQTKKSRFERWLNVEEAFCLLDPSALENKHLLVCDDVITTGSTIESLVCILPASCRVSICAIAVPVHS